LGSQCVDPGAQAKHSLDGGTALNTYLVADISRYGVDLTRAPREEKETIRFENALLLGIDFDRDGATNNRIELLQGHRRVPNPVVGLAETDTPWLGGNDNGYLDPGDTVWPQLRFWSPRDNMTLAPEDLGIVTIAIVPRVDHWDDTQRLAIETFDTEGRLVFTIETFSWQDLLE